MARLRVRAQAIPVGQLHIQSYETITFQTALQSSQTAISNTSAHPALLSTCKSFSGIGLQATIMVLVTGGRSLMMPNLPTCLWQKRKSNFRCPNFQQKKSQLFCSPAITNRSVFAISKSQRFRDAPRRESR